METSATGRFTETTSDSVAGFYRHGYQKPVMWASIVRIIATFLIFIFHFQSLNSIPHSYSLDKLGIALFLFISGYFACQNRIRPAKWLRRRFVKIMIPYWSVIIIVLTVNHFIAYKPTNFLKDIIIFSGGSMFLDNPVYVISWFITLILILYFCVFLLQSIANSLLNLLFLITLFLSFYCWHPIHNMYLPAFFAGYLIKRLELSRHDIKAIASNRYSQVNSILFAIQNYCYSFFLIHAGVLWWSIRILNLRPLEAFLFAFSCTTILSYYHKKLSDFIIKNVLISLEKKITQPDWRPAGLARPENRRPNRREPRRKRPRFAPLRQAVGEIRPSPGIAANSAKQQKAFSPSGREKSPVKIEC